MKKPTDDTSSFTVGKPKIDTTAWQGLAYICLGVLFFSTSPVLVRYAGSLNPIDITFGRMAVGAVAVALFALLTGTRPRLRQVASARLASYGLVAALHFLFYIASLSFTSIAHSLTLVYTAPIFVSAFSAAILKEKLPRAKYIGVATTIIGISILVGFEPDLTPRIVIGDVLAICSAICFGLYSIAGRLEKSSYPLLHYTFSLYAFAALWLLAPVLILRAANADFSPPSIGSLMAVVALGLFPLGIGHTLYNASLRYLHATQVNVVATQEVTGGILLGILVLGEMPTPNAVIGAAIALAGVVAVIRS